MMVSFVQWPFRDELALVQKIQHQNAIQFLGAVTQSCPLMNVTVYLSEVCSSMLLFTTWNTIFPISFIAYCFLLDLWCCQISIICMLFSLLTVIHHRQCLLMWFFFRPAFLFYNHVFLCSIEFDGDKSVPLISPALYFSLRWIRFLK